MKSNQSFRADLHSHTTCSDGSFTPVELVRKAVEIGLSGLSITDHDGVDAYETALPEARRLGLEMVSGVEFSTRYFGEGVHVLGYGFDLQHEEIRTLCERHVKRRTNRNQKMVDLLQAGGIDVSMEDLLALPGVGKVMGRPHMAQVLVNKGYVTSIKSAFRHYLGDGSRFYVEQDPVSVEETVAVIHAAGGFAVLAHPHLVSHRIDLSSLLDLGFDGIEGYYALMGPSQEEKYVSLGREKGLLITGGSDFHGETKLRIPLGCSWVNEETFSIFQERFKSLNVNV